MDENIYNEIESQKLKESEQREKTFNGMTAKEWTLNSRSVWNDLSSARKKKHLNHGATYPEKLCDRVISMYSKKGDTILDPFLGTGTTIISAINNDRYGIGIELSPAYFQLANQEIQNSVNLLSTTMFQVYNGDCEEELDNIEDAKMQLALTSPPYADLIHKVVDDRTKRHKNSAFVCENNSTTKVYSDFECDLGNMPIETYKEKVIRIMRKPPAMNVDYIFMFRIDDSHTEKTVVHYNVAIINTKLIKDFETRADSDGKLIGCLELDKIYIVK